MEWAVPTNTQLSFSNDANNRVVTGTGSGLNGEANLTFDGDALTVSGELVVNHDDWNTIRAVNTKDDTYGAYLVLVKDSASPADNDQVGVINFRGDNDAGEELTYGTIIGKSTDVTDGTEDGQLEFYTVGNGTYAERLRITSDGKVGLNEDTPLADLHIITVGSSGQNGVLQVGGSGAELGLVLDYDQSGATVSKITANPTYNNTSAQLKLAVDGDNNADQLVLTGDGNVGIGTTSPNVGSHNRALTISDTGTGARTALEIIGNTANCHAAIDFKSNSTLVSAINSRGTDRLQFCTGSSGNVKAEVTGDNFKIEDGNLIIGTAGHGIDFSANSHAAGMTSELLDSYEEGTFTPGCQYAAATSGVTISTQQGQYTKIGNTVWFHLRMILSDSGSGSNNFIVTGLPFTPNVSNVDHPMMTLNTTYGVNVGSDSHEVFVQVQSGNLYFYRYDIGGSSGGTYSVFGDGNLDQAVNFNIQGHYFT